MDLSPVESNRPHQFRRSVVACESTLNNAIIWCALAAAERRVTTRSLLKGLCRNDRTVRYQTYGVYSAATLLNAEVEAIRHLCRPHYRPLWTPHPQRPAPLHHQICT